MLTTVFRKEESIVGEKNKALFKINLQFGVLFCKDFGCHSTVNLGEESIAQYTSCSSERSGFNYWDIPIKGSQVTELGKTFA